MNNRPLIGITSSHTWAEENACHRLAVVALYVSAVERAGGVPLIIPVTLSAETLAALYSRLDGVLLPGGADVSASAYGAARVSSMYGEDATRDAAEIAISRWAVRDDKPLLAICRGIQVLNVALGGALCQHIPDEVTTTIEHDHDYATHRTHLAHEVSVEPGSLLHTILGVERLAVNSLHHQAAKHAGEGLRVVARAPDGIREGGEHPECRGGLGVQWHPEALADADPAMQRLFDALVEAARARATHRSAQAAR